jgi:tetratricopeptide (TPR) repeat protein
VPPRWSAWLLGVLLVLVQALNAALVFAWLRLMTGAMWRSLWAAALFAVHPLRVEPVLWVTERREVLCAFFDYQETLRLQPDRAEAHNNLGTAFQQQGRTGEAIREFLEALRLKPDYADARKNLIVALAAKGNPLPPPAPPPTAE